MDFESLKKYAVSIHKMAQDEEGPDLYFCRPYIEGPAYSYPEITDVLLNFVFCELKSGWVFMTNATGLSVSIPVSLYCSSSIMYSSPLQPEIKRVLRHFFPYATKLSVYNSSNTSMYDADGSLLALASFWCAVNNRFIGTEQWSQENFVGNVVNFLEQTTICFPESVLRDRLDRPVPSYSVDIFTKDDITAYRKAKTARKTEHESRLLGLLMEMRKPIQYPEPDIVNNVISSSYNSDHNSTSSDSDFVNQPRVKRRRDCLRKTTNKRNAAKRESTNSTISIRNPYKKTKRKNSRFSELVLNGNDLPLKNKFAVLSKLKNVT